MSEVALGSCMYGLVRSKFVNFESVTNEVEKVGLCLCCCDTGSVAFKASIKRMMSSLPSKFLVFFQDHSRKGLGGRYVPRHKQESNFARTLSVSRSCQGKNETGPNRPE